MSDYREMGGIDGAYPDVKAWPKEVMPNFPVYAHMLGNFAVRIDGDVASSRTICFNPMVLGGDPKQVLFCARPPLWHNGRLSADQTPVGRRSDPREAKPDPGSRPGSLNCSVIPQEKFDPWLSRSS